MNRRKRQALRLAPVHAVRRVSPPTAASPTMGRVNVNVRIDTRRFEQAMRDIQRQLTGKVREHMEQAARSFRGAAEAIASMMPRPEVRMDKLGRHARVTATQRIPEVRYPVQSEAGGGFAMGHVPGRELAINVVLPEEDDAEVFARATRQYLADYPAHPNCRSVMFTGVAAS